MRERPILMNGQMVRATLDDSKGQTRRVLPAVYNDPPGLVVKVAAPGTWPSILRSPRADEWGMYFAGQFPCHLRCPYGVPGDRLWVREAWAAADQMYQGHDLDEAGVVAYRADLSARFQNPGRYEQPGPVPTRDLASWNFDALRWRPSIFMPRWASRLTLEVTDVRVERLRDISEEDARAEGVDVSAHTDALSPALEAFEQLWDAINGARPGCSWADNAWVWVVSFRRIKGETSHA